LAALPRARGPGDPRLPLSPAHPADSAPLRRGSPAASCDLTIDETYVRVAGAWRYVYRAIDEHGQIVDVYLSVRRAIESTGVAPTEVTTDCAAAYPPTLAAVLPDVAHETGKPAQQRIERDHQHLKGRLGATRGFKTLTGAGVRCRAHAFLRNLRGGHDDLPLPFGSATAPVVPAVTHAWLALTTHLLAR
jgi:transposase-like protein